MQIVCAIEFTMCRIGVTVRINSDTPPRSPCAGTRQSGPEQARPGRGPPDLRRSSGPVFGLSWSLRKVRLGVPSTSQTAQPSEAVEHLRDHACRFRGGVEHDPERGIRKADLRTLDQDLSIAAEGYTSTHCAVCRWLSRSLEHRRRRGTTLEQDIRCAQAR